MKIVNLKMPHIKQVIIDDWQYMLSYEFVDRATEVGYTKFTELAQHAMEVLRYSESMRDDCKMIFLTHSENVGDAMNPKYSIKTPRGGRQGLHPRQHDRRTEDDRPRRRQPGAQIPPLYRHGPLENGKHCKRGRCARA